MLPRKLFKQRECPCCKRLLGEKDYNEVKSPFFPDNHLTICRQCLSSEAQSREGEDGDMEGVWDFVNRVCEWADIPFMPEEWTKLYEANPNGALGRYLDYYKTNPYARTSWQSYEDKWKKIIESGKTTDLHPVFNKEKIKQWAEDWGSSYSTEDYIKLDKIYEGLKKSFGISDVLKDDCARKMAKVSVEIDRAIAAGIDVSKLINSYNSLQKTGGFTSDNARDFNNFESCSELCLFLAAHGWKNKFHNDESQDIVDTTLKSIQHWTTRLYNNESTIADQVGERIKAKERIDRMENEGVTDSDIEKWDEENCNIVYGVDDEEEDFNPEVD